MRAPVGDLMPQALARRPTVAATYWLTRMILSEGIPGDLVECGVFCGAQAAAMARAVQFASYYRRKIHLFDSFAGIPAPGPHDNDIRPMLESCAVPVSAQTVEQVKGHMERWGVDSDLLVYHEGLFVDTVPKAEFPDGIALLRLDGDLYESTKICLECLYPKLSLGGWCIVDDWNLDGARKAAEEYLKPYDEPHHMYFQRQR